MRHQLFLHCPSILDHLFLGLLLVFVTAVISSIFSGTIGGVIGWLIRSGKA